MADEAVNAKEQLFPRLRKLARRTGCELEFELALTIKGRRTYVNEKGETVVCAGERAATVSSLKGNKDVLRALVISLAAELGGNEPDLSADTD